MDQNTQIHWPQEAVFYHIYPFGFCGAPIRNDFTSEKVPRLEKIKEWLPHLQQLGVNALYLGPLFESSAHGYDTADYYHVDRRLGSDETLAELVRELHSRGMRVILDGVFNHVGRDFWAFRDVREHGAASPYCSWFQGLSFDQRSPYGDPFGYEGWSGNYDLVKLNLRNPDVVNHLFGAIQSWTERFEIDGLRLDVADALDVGFIEGLHTFTRSLKADFWLMGEVVLGDYCNWVSPTRLDSVTNYECYKGLYSSLLEQNYFEIAYALNRQFGPQGIYRDMPLYAFADNHDVNRVTSSLKEARHLYPLYCLLFTMPGVPSIYYGSEWGVTGTRTAQSDAALRPCLDLAEMQTSAPQPHLPADIARLAALRRESPALQAGNYQQIYVSHEQFVFSRSLGSETLFIALNAADHPVELTLPLPAAPQRWVDRLNGGELLTKKKDGRLTLPPNWARVLQEA